MSRPLAAVVLAAGEGKRFKSATPKVLHDLCGRPLLGYVLAILVALRTEPTVVVVGRGAEGVKEAASRLTRRPVTFARQVRQLGTADATRAGERALGGHSGDVLVVPGDTPLLEAPTLRRLAARHRRSGAAATLLTAVLPDPTGYGRIIRGERGGLERIVEETDAEPDERRINEVSSGVWIFTREALRAVLGRVGTANRQGERYLTDAVELLLAGGERVDALPAADPVEIIGVNSRSQLADAAALLRDRTCERLMAAGVTIVDPTVTYIDAGVRVGRDSIIQPFTFLTGDTRVGAGCEVGPGARVRDSIIADGARVQFSVLDGARVGAAATVGPYAYLRPGARLERGAKVGTYVEVKASRVGPGSKVPHLSYVGDATIGAGVNVGAGTITCNYDGSEKHRTVIGDGAFIGSDTMLVAPVRIGSRAYTGAGSAITRDVPADALAVERSEQRTVRGWGADRPGRRAAGKMGSRKTAGKATARKAAGKATGRQAGRRRARSERPSAGDREPTSRSRRAT